jgi:predicted DNA-binding protein
VDKLFEKDYSPLVCKVFRKKRKLTPEEEEQVMTLEEKFATKVGASEIDRIRQEVATTIENIRGLVIAEDAIENLLELDAQLVSAKKLLLWEFDPLQVIAAKGKDAYAELVNTRKGWIKEILNQYEDNGEGY